MKIRTKQLRTRPVRGKRTSPLHETREKKRNGGGNRDLQRQFRRDLRDALRS